MSDHPKPNNDDEVPSSKKIKISTTEGNDGKRSILDSPDPITLADIKLAGLAFPCFKWVLGEKSPMKDSPVDDSRFLAFPSAYKTECSNDLKDFFVQINLATVPVALQEQCGVRSGLFQFKKDLSDPFDEGKMRIIPKSDFRLLHTVDALVNENIEEREPKNIIGWTEGVDYPSRYISEDPLGEVLAASCEERQFPQCDKMGGWAHPQQWSPSSLEEMKDCRAIFEFTDEGEDDEQKSTGQFMTECLGDGGSGSMKWAPNWAAKITNKFNDAGFFCDGG